MYLMSHDCGIIENNRKSIDYEIIGEGSQICRYCLRRKGHKSQLLAGEGSQISLLNSELLAGEGPQITQKIGGRRVTNEDFTPLKVVV